MAMIDPRVAQITTECPATGIEINRLALDDDSFLGCGVACHVLPFRYNHLEKQFVELLYFDSLL